jgi:hypothetical protein
LRIHTLLWLKLWAWPLWSLFLMQLTHALVLAWLLWYFFIRRPLFSFFWPVMDWFYCPDSRLQGFYHAYLLRLLRGEPIFFWKGRAGEKS